MEAARALLAAQRDRKIALAVLDLTPYELGNALLPGRLRVSAEQVATVLEALADICPKITPTSKDLRKALSLAEKHRLTLYDSAYAAVAARHGAQLATLDRELLGAGLGRRPSEIAAELPSHP